MDARNAMVPFDITTSPTKLTIRIESSAAVPKVDNWIIQRKKATADVHSIKICLWILSIADVRENVRKYHQISP